MLGQFLEFSAAAHPLADSFEFFRGLGFTDLPVGDLLAHPYVVLFDGAIAIGLHDREQAGPQLTFVRPDLRDYVRPLRRLGVEFRNERLRESEFNSVAFSDPGGQEIALIEARTFPPGDRAPHRISVCGTLVELSLPAAELSESTRFWQAFGLVASASGELPHRWQRLTGRGVTLGLHETHCPPGLSFRCSDLAARLEYLRAKGFRPRPGNPLADRGQAAATLTAPDGTTFYLLEGGAQ
jgi:catechol 2,3-dioxygenase-like lactoylglutathione lyase family enzyme